jgi:hypothetical protein
MAISFGSLLSRYCIVTILPALVATSIYADYSHTQKYKARKQQNEAEVLFS